MLASRILPLLALTLAASVPRSAVSQQTVKTVNRLRT